VDIFFLKALANSTVKIPVGIAIILQPMIIMKEAIILPIAVCGNTSPYPTVVIVTIAQ